VVPTMARYDCAKSADAFGSALIVSYGLHTFFQFQ
jgi:hypothetical protein